MPANLAEAAAERSRLAPRDPARARLAAAVVAAALGGSCVLVHPTPELAQHVLAVQGGPLDRFCRQSELTVHYGFPGLWAWRVAYRAPGQFGLSMVTEAGTQEYVTDGSVVRGSTDGALLVSEPLDTSALRSLLRWTTVTTLTALGPSYADAVTIRPAADERRFALRRSLRISWPDAQSDYVLTFDRDGLLQAAAGPIEIPPVGSGRLEASFSDYREVGTRRLPFFIRYRLNGHPLLDERVRHFEAALDDERDLTAVLRSSGCASQRSQDAPP